MAFVEMVEMVDILKRVDYDGKYGPYSNPNVRKAKIMAKVVKSLHRHFGVRRSKDQLRKRWSDLKLREHNQYRRIRECCKKVSSCPVFLFFIFITSVLLHMLFFTVAQFKMATFMFMGTIIVRRKHCSFSH
ncbi:hypothetical protein AB205_0166430 [Aquarana catesbeiana]|uniref:MADF domain-containing protein n=1 Tax=Aquarana catesbeiana TaxID=8400 RepID=A0A2G9SAF9_AQUCT|nr:hypothetical protein AB205_0166430 [Aquarana catesbeiana]